MFHVEQWFAIAMYPEGREKFLKEKKKKRKQLSTALGVGMQVFRQKIRPEARGWRFFEETNLHTVQ